MEENSPVKHKHTSKVIDSLHSQIDTLKNELETVKVSGEDYKKKYSLVAKKNESFVDQLANAKHENDMINALLKRKERRISDLEDQYNELFSTNESLQLNNKNMRIRCDNLQESSASSTAEFERLKIAYDALIASQVEYKKHYTKELSTLTSQFEAYKLENTQRYEALSQKLSNNDKDVDTLLDSLTNKRKTMDNLYVNKNKTILELLTKLAKASRIHGQESKATLQDSVDTVQALLVKHPDLQAKLSQHEKVDIDLEEFLNESNETLFNTSFDEEATLINSPELNDTSLSNNDSTGNTPNRQQMGHQKTSSISRSNTVQAKRRKNKRNSIRFDSKSGPDFSSFNTPTTPTQLTLPKRPNMNQLASQGQVQGQLAHNNPQSQSQKNYYDGKPRTPTPPSNNDPQYDINPAYQFNSYSNSNSNFNNQQNHAPQFGNNNSNSNQRSYRNSSSNGSYNNGVSHNQQYHNGNQGNQQQNNNGGNKKFNRRSTYGNNNNGNGNNYNKRNSQLFEPNSLNLALNT